MANYHDTKVSSVVCQPFVRRLLPTPFVCCPLDRVGKGRRSMLIEFNAAIIQCIVENLKF